MREYNFFNLEEIADGVFAAIIKNGTGALGNAGFIDLGEETLVFDTFLIPDAAEELKRVAEEKTGNQVKYVINSHWHGDHVFGNQVFSNAVIISTEKTQELFLEMNNINKSEMSKSLAQYLETQEQQLEEQIDEKRRLSLREDIADKRALLEAVPNLNPVPPTITYNEQLCLTGTKRKVELLSYGGGHTLSDTFLYLPDEKILFAADLVIIDHHPWMGAGQPEEWLEILGQLEKLEFTTVVPGHGSVGNKGKEHLAWIRNYLKAVLTTVESYKEKNNIPDNDEEIKVPEIYEELQFAGGFQQNVLALLKR